ncbi:MAG TPA: VWA domain-containing protein [Methylomicrobium sp.]|nr:VWA domain-containing protein [Methylomicrobium sp.]
MRYFLPPVQPIEQAALKVPFLDDFSSGRVETVSQSRQWPLWLALIAWLLLVIAAARPQWLGDPVEQVVNGRDLMLAIDLSGSMEEQDFFINKHQVDRLSAAKWVAGDFIERRIGDRVGLILFGSQAYLQTPLTFDRNTVRTLLNEAVIGLAGDNTAIGDAIGLAVKRLKNQEMDSRVLILMTDGANTAGEISPIKAAELAADNQLKIYTIGIGADEMIVRSLFGTHKVNPSRDLDEKTLLDIAQKTGGRYFRARNASELNNIYMLLDKLEPVKKDSQSFRPRRELFYWPLALALGLTGLISVSRLKWS